MAGNNYNVIRVYRIYLGDLNKFNCSHSQYNKLPDQAKLAANLILVNVCEYNHRFERAKDIKLGLICNDVMEQLYRPISSEIYSNEMNLNQTDPHVHYNNTQINFVCHLGHNSLNCKLRCFEEEPPMVAIPSWQLKKSNQFYRENSNCLTCLTQLDYEKIQIYKTNEKKQLEFAIVILYILPVLYLSVFLIDLCGWIVGCYGLRLTDKAGRYAILTLSLAFRQHWNGQSYCANMSNNKSQEDINKCICNMELTFYTIDWLATLTILLGSYVGPCNILTIVVVGLFLVIGRRQLMEWFDLKTTMSVKRCVFAGDNLFLLVLAVILSVIILGLKRAKVRDDWRRLSKLQVICVCLTFLADLAMFPSLIFSYGPQSSRIRGPMMANILSNFSLALLIIRSLKFK